MTGFLKSGLGSRNLSAACLEGPWGRCCHWGMCSGAPCEWGCPTSIARLVPAVESPFHSWKPVCVREAVLRAQHFHVPTWQFKCGPSPGGNVRGHRESKIHLSLLCREHRCCSSANSLTEHEIRSQSLDKSSSSWPPLILGKDSGFKNQVWEVEVSQPRFHEHWGSNVWKLYMETVYF